MKIKSILENIRFKEIKSGKFNLDVAATNSYNRIQTQNDFDMSGGTTKAPKKPSGAFGFVSSKPDSQEVTKQPHTPETEDELGDDGFHHFITIAIQHQDNPAFPKIHDVVVKKGGEHYLPHYKMEKLIPTNKIPKEILDSLFERLFGAKKTKIQAVATLEHAIQSNKFDGIVDEHLKNACQILASNKDNFNIDLHFNNFMFRFAGGSYQLVIIDPFLSKIHPEE